MRRLKKIIEGSKSLVNKSQYSYGYAAFGIALLLLFTKITGIFKLQLLTSIYGISSKELDIFQGANTIPEFIFTIVAIGGINAALIPVLTQTSVNENESRLKEVFSSLVNIFFLALVVLCFIVFIFAPQIIHSAISLKIANTTSPLTPEDIDKFVVVLRILIFSPIILTISSIFSSILQIKRRFWITALSPLFYNLGLIFTAAFILPFFHKDVVVLAVGVILGSLLHFLIQLPAILQSEIHYSPFIILPKDLYVIKAIKQTLPRIIGLTSDYIGNIFQTILALSLVEGSLNTFRLAISLREIPISLFGMAISVSVFPSLSELAERKKFDELQILFSKALRSILFWTLPVTVLFLVLRTPIVRFTFGIFNKNVTLAETSLLSYTVLFLSLGIVFYSVLQLVGRTFYSLNDVKTPTIVSMIAILVELALTYSLANLFSHFNSLSLNPLNFIKNVNDYFTIGSNPEGAAVGGIALASSASIFVNLALLTIFLKRKGISVWYEPQYIFKKIISSGAMFVVGLGSFKYLDTFFNDDRILGVFLLTANVTFLMGLTYYLSERVLKDDDIENLNDPIKKIKRGLEKVKQLIKLNKLKGIGT